MRGDYYLFCQQIGQCIFLQKSIQTGLDLAKLAVDGAVILHFFPAVTFIFAVGTGVDKVFLSGGAQHLEQGYFGGVDDKPAAAGGAAGHLYKTAGGKLFQNFISKLFGELFFRANLWNAAQLAVA